MPPPPPSPSSRSLGHGLRCAQNKPSPWRTLLGVFITFLQMASFPFTSNSGFGWVERTTLPIRWASRLTNLSGYMEWMKTGSYLAVFYLCFAWIALTVGLFIWAVACYIRQAWPAQWPLKVRGVAAGQCPRLASLASSHTCTCACERRSCTSWPPPPARSPSSPSCTSWCVCGPAAHVSMSPTPLLPAVPPQMSGFMCHEPVEVPFWQAGGYQCYVGECAGKGSAGQSGYRYLRRRPLPTSRLGWRQSAGVPRVASSRPHATVTLVVRPSGRLQLTAACRSPGTRTIVCEAQSTLPQPPPPPPHLLSRCIAPWVAAGHLLQVIIAALLMAAFVAICAFFSLTFFDAHPLSTSLSSRAHGRADFVLLLTKLVMVTVADVFTISVGPVAASALVVVSGAVWVAAYLYFMPFTHHVMNRAHLGFATMYWWTGLCLLLADHVPGFDAGIMMWAGYVPLFIAGVAVADFRAMRIYRCPVARLDNGYEVELKVRRARREGGGGEVVACVGTHRHTPV
jgi:hypothetical protein